MRASVRWPETGGDDTPLRMRSSVMPAGRPRLLRFLRIMSQMDLQQTRKRVRTRGGARRARRIGDSTGPAITFGVNYSIGRRAAQGMRLFARVHLRCGPAQ